MTITLRATKGYALTWPELDDNFTHLVNATKVSVLNYIPLALWAGIRDGTGVVPLQSYIQLAVNYVSGINGCLTFPGGAYVISAPITFPSESMIISGEGPTETGISELFGSGQIRLFDLSGIAGPSVLIENMGFYGPTGAGVEGGTGCYVAGSNGVAIRNCWFAGLTNGIHKTDTASFLRSLDNTFEFCLTGQRFEGGVQCIVSNATYYRNTADFYATGDFNLGIVDGMTMAETSGSGLTLDGVIDGHFSNMTFRQDFAQRLPDLIVLTNASKRNTIKNARTKNFGRVLVKMASAAGCTDNVFDGMHSTNVTVIAPSQAVPVGTGGALFEIGSTNTGNTFKNYSSLACDYGIIEASGLNKFRSGSIRDSVTAGVLLQNADETDWYDLTMSGNLVDWVTSGAVPTVWMDQVNSTMAGLTPTRLGTRRAGIYGRTFYGAGAPATLAYILSDRVINVTPAVGQPKAFACTVAGTPGTWVSEGNL